MKKFFLFVTSLLLFVLSKPQSPGKYILLKPDRVFDGEQMQTGWVVLVKNDSIIQAGNMLFKLPAGTQVIELKGCTLLPGLIEGHSHLFLHPYNETKWEDQVLKESRAERTARAITAAAIHSSRFAVFLGRDPRRTATRFCPRKNGDSCSASRSTSRASSKASRSGTSSGSG